MNCCYIIDSHSYNVLRYEPYINFFAILATMASKDDISKDNVDKVPASDQSK